MNNLPTKVLSVVAAFIVSLFLGGCYDDTEIRERLDDYEMRLSALENECAEMNTNIASMQQVLLALQNNDFVTNVAPITEDGKEIGYTITFSKSGPVTIYHGKDGADGQNGKDGKDGKDGVDGQDGSTPLVGLQQDTDGLWYWTLNGEWLLDDQGAKVKAVGINGQDGKDGQDGQNGKDGKDGQNGQDGQDGQNGRDGQDGQNGKDGQDGVTPQLKIQGSDWYISYDDGKSWKKVGRATGQDGKNGRDGQDGADGTNGRNGRDGTSFFSSVTLDAEYVYLTLADGTIITLPKFLPLSIEFSNTADTLEVTKQQLVQITYKFQASTEKVHIEAISSSDISIILTVPVVTEDKGTYYGEGTLNIQVGDRVDAFSKVTVFLSDERRLLMRTYAFKMRN